MISLFLPPSGRARSAAELMIMLEDASDELLSLEECAAGIAEASEATIFCPRQLQNLRAVLERGREAIATRMAVLGGPRATTTLASHRASRRESRKIRPRALMRAYGKCSHQLCRVAQEARRIADSATAAVLSDLILQTEKQLWLLDAPSRQREPASRRVVSFFFSY